MKEYNRLHIVDIPWIDMGTNKTKFTPSLTISAKGDEGSYIFSENNPEDLLEKEKIINAAASAIKTSPEEIQNRLDAREEVIWV